MQFQVTEMLQGQLEHHEEVVVIRSRAIVEEIVRLPGQRLQISHSTPDQAPSQPNTTENIPAPTVSSLPETSSNARETVPPILSAPRFVPAGTSPSAPVLVSDPTSSEAPASVPTPIFFSMVPARMSSKVPASVRALNTRSAPVFFPPQTASNAPETVPGPTASKVSETVPGPTASKVPETVPGPTASKVPKIDPIPTTSNIPETLPAPTWSKKSEILPAKTSCQPETCPVTTSGDTKIKSGLGSLSTVSGIASAPFPGSYTLWHQNEKFMLEQPLSIFFSFQKFVQLQEKLRVSLHRTWKHALAHDWR